MQKEHLALLNTEARFCEEQEKDGDTEWVCRGQQHLTTHCPNYTAEQTCGQHHLELFSSKKKIQEVKRLRGLRTQHFLDN